MMDDATLLDRYARHRSENDFAEIVRRHLDFVYSAALRQVNGDTHLAEDVTQVVFTDLARKASSVAGHRVLAGWLFTSTRYTAAKMVRTMRRRQAREMEATLMHDNSQPDAGSQLEWARIQPVLDEALAELNERDREAILLRYFEGRDFAQVGARLSLSDNAARMRVERAIDKLRNLLARRGATSSAAALTLALTGQATAAAPVGLATSVTGAALAGTGAVATLTFMGLTKLQVGIASAVLVAGAGIYTTQELRASELRSEMASHADGSAKIAHLREENEQLDKISQQFANLKVSEGELARLRGEVAAQAQRLAAINRPVPKAAIATATAPRFASETLPIQNLDVRPKPTKMVAPVYPAELASAATEGSVVVSFVVDANGKVQGAKAVEAAQPEFVSAALAAVEQWQFEPGLKGGRMVNTQVTQKLFFRMKNTQDATPAPKEWF